LASSKETHGCASRKARIWSGSVIMGKEYGLPVTLRQIGGGVAGIHGGAVQGSSRMRSLRKRMGEPSLSRQR
jgi:hypothetical protein